MKKLTEIEFWENFWENVELPEYLNPDLKNDRVISEVIKRYVPSVDGDGTALEVGCAPGKWLAFFNKELGYSIRGFDYVQSAVETTRTNLTLLGIPEDQFEISVEDFNMLSKKEKYDVVCSFGFIEHFDDTERVFDGHLELVKQDGFLIIGLPSLNGINKWVHRLCDRDCAESRKLIPKHHLESMNLGLYQRLAVERGVEVVFIGYIGGFEPSMFNTQLIRNKLLRLLTRIVVKTFSIVFFNTNNRFTSSYIMTIYKTGKSNDSAC